MTLKRYRPPGERQGAEDKTEDRSPESGYPPEPTPNDNVVIRLWRVTTQRDHNERATGMLQLGYLVGPLGQAKLEVVSIDVARWREGLPLRVEAWCAGDDLELAAALEERAREIVTLWEGGRLWASLVG